MKGDFPHQIAKSISKCFVFFFFKFFYSAAFETDKSLIEDSEVQRGEMSS